MEATSFSLVERQYEYEAGNLEKGIIGPHEKQKEHPKVQEGTSSTREDLQNNGSGKMCSFRSQHATLDLHLGDRQQTERKD